LNVAIHEIGHALGLGHSREDNVVMFPFVQNGQHTLAEEDIRGILSLYPFRVGAGARASVVYRIDGIDPGVVGTGGDHLGAPGTDANLRPGARVGFGRSVTFRLRSMHVSDLESYGVGCVVTLD
jgi:hypothetical protein